MQKDKQRTGRTNAAVANLLSVGQSTVDRVIAEHKQRTAQALQEGRDPSDVRPPPDEPETRKRDPKVKESHVDFVSRCLSKMMYDQDLAELPTVTSMYEFVIGERGATAKARHCKVEDVFPFSRATFHDILQTRLGYVHKAPEDDRDQLKIQKHVIELRTVFLRVIEACRRNGHILWYLDETWVNKNTSRRKSWELGKSKTAEAASAAGVPDVLRPKGKKKPPGKGGRAIVIGIGSVLTGVVPDLLEIFKGTKSKKEDDYHKEMNGVVFEEWLDKALDWIAARYPSDKHTIVMDNAAYHSRLTEDCITPTLQWRKDKIIEYMIDNRIVPSQLLPGYKTREEAMAVFLQSLKDGVPCPYTDPVYTGGPLPTTEQYNTLTKKIIISKIPTKEKKHVTDEMCKAKGFNVIRLPPYHCEFNPIELVWAKAKAEVAKQNVQYKLSHAMDIMRKETVKCDAVYWAKLDLHAKKEEEAVGGGDQLILNAIQLAENRSLVIDMTSDTSSDDEDTRSNEGGA